MDIGAAVNNVHVYKIQIKHNKQEDAEGPGSLAWTWYAFGFNNEMAECHESFVLRFL